MDISAIIKLNGVTLLGRGLALATVSALACGAGAGKPPELTALKKPIPAAVGHATRTGAPDLSQVLHIAVAIPPRNAQAVQVFADEVSEPASPYYGRYVTPAEFGQMFGASATDVNRVVSYLKSEGFQIKLVADSHLAILADCTVAQADAAFHTDISTFHTANPGTYGRADFFAFDRPLQVPSSIARQILTVTGLENSTKPVPRLSRVAPVAKPAVAKQGGVTLLTPTQTRVLYNLAPIYNAGMTGTGRHIGISSFDGFSLSNIPLWYAQYNLPTPIGGVGANVTVVTVDGGSQNNPPGGEGDLDQQMVLGMAPTCQLTIYDGVDILPVLTQEAQDNADDIFTESYGWVLDPTTATACHNAHLQMTTQGITYMEATGDDGTTLEPAAYSNYEPEVFQVGGNIATVAAGGTRISEVGWSGSGGGWATDAVAFNVLPSWQKGRGVPTDINFRLNPDVALHAAGDNGAYYFYLSGQLTTGFDGTSFASPVFAGGLGVSEQKMISLGDIVVNRGKYRLGRISNVVYQQNGRSDVWYDITSGSNGSLPNGQNSSCTAFWDFVTGFGAIDFNAFVRTFTTAQHPVDIAASSVGVYDGQGASPEGGIGGLAGISGDYYSESSVPSTQGQIDAAIITFSLTQNVSNFSSIGLNLTESGPSGTTNFVYVFNYTTRNFDLMNTSPNTGSDTKLSVSIVNFANYVSPSGEIQVVDRMVWPNRVGQPYVMKLNLAQIAAVPNG